MSTLSGRAGKGLEGDCEAQRTPPHIGAYSHCALAYGVLKVHSNRARSSEYNNSMFVFLQVAATVEALGAC